MRLLTNFHTHTSFCDGTDSAEEMIARALALGFSTLGFSSHADPPQGVPMDVDAYLAEIRRLQWEYRDRLEILRGVELDNIMSPDMAKDVEYRIGSTHNIPPKGHPAWKHALSVAEAQALCQAYCKEHPLTVADHSPTCETAVAGLRCAQNNDALLSSCSCNSEPDCGFLCVDYKPEKMHELCREWYDGDYYALASDYFRFESMVVQRTRPAFIGHFDLVTRFNDLPKEDGGCFLDETERRYLDAAAASMEQIIRDGVRYFEVNCGATNRGRKRYPYPAPALLRILRDLGGEVLINSDAHSKEKLDGGFDDALRLVKECGFDRVNVLTRTETDTPAVNTMQDTRFTDGRENVPLYWKTITI